MADICISEGFQTDFSLLRQPSWLNFAGEGGKRGKGGKGGREGRKREGRGRAGEGRGEDRRRQERRGGEGREKQKSAFQKDFRRILAFYGSRLHFRRISDGF